PWRQRPGGCSKLPSTGRRPVTTISRRSAKPVSPASAATAVDIKQRNSYIWGMAQQLSPQQENLVSEALRSGAYESPNEVIDRALATLREQDEWLMVNRHAIDAKIHRGIEELERGEGIPEDELDAWLARLKARTE